MDRAKFYAVLRERKSGVFGTALSQRQVDGLEFLLNQAEKRQTLRAHLAYILATVYHETAHTMQPIEEYGRGRGRKYGVPVGPYGKVYYGRGYVQLTWLGNYEFASKKFGIDFVKYPERVMEPNLAAAILFTGMEEGWFTGKRLDQYINLTTKDYVNARRIINATDKAEIIAKQAETFERALIAGDYTRQNIVKLEVKPAPAAPTPRPANKSYSGIIAILAMLSGAAIVLFDRFFQ